MTDCTVIILTKNEALHIVRAIHSVQSFATRVLVVDSGSTDATVALARSAGAEVMHNPWVNYATQFNWALDQIADCPGWVLRLDADEVVDPVLIGEIRTRLKRLPEGVNGVTLGRRMNFMGHPVHHGGLFPIRVLRLFRNGFGRCEDRWMDEHIIVNGEMVDFEGEILDDNRNCLDWWVAKHNSYASREAVDILNQQYGFMAADTVARLHGGGQAGLKRWIKEKIYNRLPGGLRAGLYFLYRYVLRLGFLDGREGRAFHILQGFWYRYLVDAKLAEVRRYMARTGAAPEVAIRDVLGVTLPLQLPIKQRVAA